ncbi:hypothetical protein [Alteromonas sp. C1M14]|uniref:hypothetical protein n=1 Tax=Alteromonas sp. C1M14 TaxID=2841567 RepID=UPI001C09240C|nr:hypothetical protein [Alteromonas sp. C1M14]MBU2978121.1 hypothetical protein [Alteromonas sp. C1M14]
MNEAHGEFTITRSGNVMLTQAFGPWNTECVEQFAKHYANELGSLKDESWADIIVLRGESLLIPEAERTLSEKVRWATEHGLKDVAIVTGESFVGVASRMQLEKLYTHFEFEYAFFRYYEEASTWLTQKGYHMDSDTELTFKQRLPHAALHADV